MALQNEIGAKRDVVAANHLAGDIRDKTAAWREALRVAWSVYLPMRLMLSLAGILIVLAEPHGRSPGAFLGWLDRLLVAPWNHYDVTHYARLAQDGYRLHKELAVFHPLLPLLMRLFGAPLGGQYVLAGVIVSNLACLLLLATLYRLVALDHGPVVARDAAMWMLLTPTGYVLLLPYTESLLLCFALLAFWFARFDRWLAAGVCGALAALTKQPGIVLVLPLLVEYLRNHRRDLKSARTLKVLACLGLIPLAYVAFSVYRAVALSDVTVQQPTSFVSALLVSKSLGQTWGTRFGWPWEWAAGVIAYMPRGDVVFWAELLLAGVQLAILACAMRQARASAALWSLLQVGMALTLVLATEPLLSLPRRFMLAFPVYIQLALWSTGSRHRRILTHVGLMSALGLGMMFSAERFIP